MAIAGNANANLQSSRPRRRAAPTRPCPSSAATEEATRFGWPTVIVTAVVALSLGGIVGGIVGGIIGGSGDGTATTAEPNATVTDTISDGVHEVGVDVKAGQYKTNVPEGEFCYWERRRGADESATRPRATKKAPLTNR